MKTKLILLFAIIVSTLSLNAESLRVEFHEIRNDLNRYTIIDTRSEEEYAKSHIRTAINIPIKLTYQNSSINGQITEPNKMQEILRSAGLDRDDNIITYDDGSFFDAARLFWTLEVYGFTNVKILNGGFNEWASKDLPTSNESVTPQRSNYIAFIDNKKLATKFSTQIATKTSTQVVIDARPYSAFSGQKSSAKRFGHIPSAIHIPATHNIASNGDINKLKDISELRKVYGDIKKDSKVILYCAVGRVSATNYFTMRELGFNVANYDASWREWGNDFNLPIVNPSEK